MKVPYDEMPFHKKKTQENEQEICKTVLIVSSITSHITVNAIRFTYTHVTVVVVFRGHLARNLHYYIVIF